METPQLQLFQENQLYWMRLLLHSFYFHFLLLPENLLSYHNLSWFCILFNALLDCQVKRFIHIHHKVLALFHYTP